MGKLTPPQQEAVNEDGHLLIVAGPGSGKTSTSVAKARRILRDPARSLVMVTFTREAADEMSKRLRKAMDQASMPWPGEERLLIATFHSIALRHLKRHGLKKKLLSPQQQNLLYQDAAQACDVDRDEWGDVQKQFESVMYAVDPTAVQVSEKAARVLRRYRELLANTGQIDLYTVMRDCSLGVAEGRIAPLPYTDMLVDEGQDTDGLQQHWLFAHARAGCRVTIVGDDDQSIYEWRNALGYQGMRQFLDTFRARRIELGDNFRCRAEILTPAATLIARNQARLSKHLVARRGNGGCILAFHDAGGRHAMMVRAILDVPEKHANAAILARTNKSLDAAEIALRAEGISYTRIGNSIWDAPFVGGYIGLLQTLLDGSPTGLLAAMQLRDIDARTRQEVLNVHSGNVAALLGGEVPSLSTATAVDKERLFALAKALSYWRRQLHAGAGGPTGSVVEVVLDVANAMAEWTRSDTNKRLVQLCGQALARMRGPLSQRLQFVTRRERTSEAQLTLMTMHGAKGLEFETVHIIDANRTDDTSNVVHPEAERRLMYVAMTRAKNACVIWFSGEPHPNVREADLPPTTEYPKLVERLRASG